MPPPRPPSRIDLITFPVFASTWHGTPSLPPSNTGGCSILAYSGGGGSAKTGVFNLIHVATSYQVEEGESGYVSNDFQLDTGEQIGVGVDVFRRHDAKTLHDSALLAAAVGDEIRVYEIPLDPDEMDVEATGSDNAQQLLRGSVVVGEKFGCNAVSWDAIGRHIAVGCENGRVRVYAVVPSENEKGKIELNLVKDCVGHEKAVCSVKYHPRGGAVLSSAKDGTARIWDVRDTNSNTNTPNGTELAVFQCSIEPKDGPQKPPAANANARNRRPPQILVRGCAFGDLEGKVIYTVASGRKGSAYLSRWRVAPPRQQPAPTPGKPPLSAKKPARNLNQLRTVEDVRVECHPMPVSAVSLSGDASHLALGCVDGTVTYLNVETMKPTKKWVEIHDLPVTCIAARPTHLPLPGEEEEGVNVDVMSASADNRLSKLTLQRRSRKRSRDGGGGSGVGGMFGLIFGLLGMIFSLSSFFVVGFGLILAILWQLSLEACEAEITARDMMAAKECIWHTVLWAPSDRPGVSFPPH